MDPSVIQITGPLTPYLEGFWESLLAQGYTPLSCRNQARLVAHVSRWLKRQRLSVADLGDEQIERFLRHRKRAGYTSFRSKNGVRPLLRYLGGLELIASHEATEEITESPISQVLARYERHLAERELAQGTVHRYLDVARRFVTDELGGVALAYMTASNVSDFILRSADRFSVGTAKLQVSALRSFLRYLFINGDLDVDLAAAVPAVAGWRLASLPKGLNADEVKRLLRCQDRRTHVGRRDYGVILIMVRLGLRACEVAALTLDDVDWAHGEIIVHGKGGRDDRLPLPDDIGSALAAYIRWSRPDVTTRRLFMRVHAPLGGLSAGAAKMIVRKGGQRAGLSGVSAHRLRHTAATEMLRRGAGLSDIAQVLRHRSLDTTAIYAKVDRTALRDLAQPWPGGGV